MPMVVRGTIALRQWLAARDNGQKRTQARLAEAVGINQPNISSWKDGKTRPSLKFALALERATGIPAEWWDEPAPERPAGRSSRPPK